MAKFNSETARAAGRKGGRAKGRHTITIEKAEQLLPPMDSVENIIRRLELVAVWASAGVIPGVTAHALTRGCEVALRAFDSERSREIIEKLKVRLEDLEEQLGRKRMGIVK